jgi:hypothetical protein
MALEIITYENAQDLLEMLSGIVKRSELMYERTGASGATVHEYKALKLVADLEIRDLQRAIDNQESISTVKRLADEARKDSYLLLRWVGEQIKF